MPYNLRARTLGENLLANQQIEEDFGGDDSDNEEDFVEDLHHETDSEEDGLESEYENNRPNKRMREREEHDNLLDDIPLANRLLQSRRSLQGRPKSKLYGKGKKNDRYVWSTNKPSRHSGK